MTLRDELKNLVRFRCASPTKRTSGGGGGGGGGGYRKGGDSPPFTCRGRFLILMIFIDPTQGLKKTCKLVV